MAFFFLKAAQVSLSLSCVENHQDARCWPFRVTTGTLFWNSAQRLNVHSLTRTTLPDSFVEATQYFPCQCVVPREFSAAVKISFSIETSKSPGCFTQD